MVADDTQLERNTGGLGVTDGTRDARIRHGDDEVGGDPVLAGEFGTNAFAYAVDAAILHHAIGAGEIDILENAEARRLRGEGEQAAHAAGIDDDHLAGGDVAYVIGTDNVERAGLGGDDVGIAELAEDEWANAVRVAHADQRLRREDDERIGTFDGVERVDDAIRDGGGAREGDAVDDDFGIGGGGEERTAGDELAAQGNGVGEVAVMGEGEAAEREVGIKGLHVAQQGFARGGVAVMADGGGTVQTVHHGRIRETITDEAEGTMREELAVIATDDARCFLPAMLQGMQAEGGVGGGIRCTEDAEDTAFVVEFIEHQRLPLFAFS